MGQHGVHRIRPKLLVFNVTAVIYFVSMFGSTWLVDDHAVHVIGFVTYVVRITET